MTGDIKL